MSVGRQPASRRADAGPPSGSTSSRPTSPPALPISWSSLRPQISPPSPSCTSCCPSSRGSTCRPACGTAIRRSTVVQRLKSQGLYDKALVILIADHGISFTPGKAPRTLQDGNAHELMWVPLFVKTPQQRTGAVSDRSIEQVDLLPTIADVLKIKVPWRVDGVSALAPERSRRTKSFFNKPNRVLSVDGPATWRWLCGVSPTGSPGPRMAWTACSRSARSPTWSAAGPRRSAWRQAAGWWRG